MSSSSHALSSKSSGKASEERKARESKARESKARESKARESKARIASELRKAREAIKASVARQASKARESAAKKKRESEARKARQEPYRSQPYQRIFSNDNRNGFLELIDNDRGRKNVILIYEIVHAVDAKGEKIYELTTHKGPFFDDTELKKIRENNKKMLKEMGILTHHQYTIPTGGKKTHKHRKGKKYYKKRTLRKRK